jgi:hypothetical protein
MSSAMSSTWHYKEHHMAIQSATNCCASIIIISVMDRMKNETAEEVKECHCGLCHSQGRLRILLLQVKTGQLHVG